MSDSEKGVFWKRGLFRKVHFLETLENLEILEILENPQTVENKGECDHFLEILEISRDSRDSSSEKTPFVMTPFSGPDYEREDRWLRWPHSRESIRLIRANRLILANRFRVPKLNPFICKSRFEGLKIANRRSKFPEKNNAIFKAKFPKFAPKFAPKFPVLSWQVEKSSPQISPPFSYRRFQISNQILNLISPKISQHFCRLGSPSIGGGGAK